MSTHFLPQGWSWCPIGKLLSGTQYGLNTPNSERGNTPIVGMKDVVNGRVLDGNLAHVTLSASEASAFLLKPGDILLNRTNSYDLVGKIGYVDKPIRAVFASYLVRLLPNHNMIDARYLAHWLSSSLGQRQIKPLITRGVSQANINPTAFCGSVLVPVAPFAQQRQMADIITTWDDALMRKRALSGELSRMYRAVADRFLHVRGNNMVQLARVLLPDRMEAVAPAGPFRALGVRSHGKGTFIRIDALAAVESGKTVYRIEPNRFIANIVFAWEGAAAITSEADSGCLVSHRFPTFRINKDVLDVEYFRHVIRTEPFRQLLALASPGGAGRNKTLNRTDLLRFEIHVPPVFTQRTAADALNSLDRRILLLNSQIERLVCERDGLATQLLTGRLCIPDYAQAVDLEA